MDLPAAAPDGPGLPDWAAGHLAGFERHLAAERGLSRHTVRAYLGDVTALLEHACACGLESLAGLALEPVKLGLADQSLRKLLATIRTIRGLVA